MGSTLNRGLDPSYSKMGSIKLQVVLLVSLGICLVVSRPAVKPAVVVKPAPPKPVPALTVQEVNPKDDKLANDKCFCDENSHSHDPPGTETITFPDESIGITEQTKIALPVVNIPNGKTEKIAVAKKPVA